MLANKKIIDVAVGAMHCLAITDDGEVFSWGRNDQGQLGDTSLNSKSDPCLMTVLEGKNIIGVACGPSQVGSLIIKIIDHSWVALFNMCLLIIIGGQPYY